MYEIVCECGLNRTVHKFNEPEKLNLSQLSLLKKIKEELGQLVEHSDEIGDYEQSALMMIVFDIEKFIS